MASTSRIPLVPRIHVVPHFAYIPGAQPPPSAPDTRPATETNAYINLPVVLVNPPPAAPIHMEDTKPRDAVWVSPYPVSTYVRIPDASVPDSIPDPEGPKSRRRVTRLPEPL